MGASSFAEARKQLEQIAAAPQKIAVDAAHGIRLAVRREFTAEADPYGAAWAALAPSTVARKGSSKILTETGLTAGSVDTVVSGTTIRVSVGGESHWHQSGMPARPILPNEGDIPGDWNAILEGAAARALPKGAI